MGKNLQCAEFDDQAIRKDNLVIHHLFIHMGQNFQCA